ncbi:hypothetical protein [Streptomyces sp. NPDC054765]
MRAGGPLELHGCLAEFVAGMEGDSLGQGVEDLAGGGDLGVAVGEGWRAVRPKPTRPGLDAYSAA